MKKITLVVIGLLMVCAANSQNIFRNNHGDTLTEFSAGDTVTWVLDYCISAGYEQGSGSNATQAIALVNKIKVATTFGTCGWIPSQWDTAFVYTINNVNIGGRRMFTIVLPDLGTDSSVRYLSIISYSTGKIRATNAISHDSIVIFSTPALPFNAKASITKDSVHISTKGIYGKDSMINIAVQPGDSSLVKVITTNKFGKCADSLERWVGNPYIGDTIRFTETEVYEYKRVFTDAQLANIGLSQPTYSVDTGSIYAVYYLDVLRPGTYKAQFNFGSKENIYVDVVPSVLVIYAKPSTNITVTNANGCFGDSAHIMADKDSIAWFTYDDQYLHSKKDFYTDSNGIYKAKVYNVINYELSVPSHKLPHISIASDFIATIDSYTAADSVGSEFRFEAFDLKGTYLYEWFVDGISESKGKQLVHTLTDTGIHKVVLDVMNVNYPHCGSKYDSVNVYVLPKIKSPDVGFEFTEWVKILVYPNPIVSQLNIEHEGLFTYHISSLTGDILVNGQGEGKCSLQLDDLVSGVYFLRITANGNHYSLKIVKL
ncbi:MAG: T9SS type A sorting domain-containing protein [Bacteroidetes bacterium]|nr:MAG: T9SS type A sorting domain-containing protein [Bacteroidota bacterium]